MSSAGINPLAIYDPEIYAKQLAIQRRQALAQSLLGQGEQSAGASPYGGLANAGKSLLGAFLAKRSDQQLGDLYNPQPQQGGQDTGQITNMASQGQGEPQAPAPQGTQPTPGGPAQGAPGPGQAQQQASPGNPSDYDLLPPAAKRVYDQIPHIPGMPAQQALNFFMTNPTGYQAEWAKMYEQPDAVKVANYAAGGNQQVGQQFLAGQAMKNATNTLRPGNMSQNLITGQMTGVPNNQGITPTQMGDGQIGMQMAPGAAGALQASSYASQLGAAGTKPAIGYDVNNMPVATNQAQMLGNGPSPSPGPAQQPLNINANNPLNVQSNGRDIQYATPTAGLGKAWETLGQYGQKGINTVAGIVKTWTGGTAPPQYAASVAQALKVDPNQPLNLADPNVKGALIDAMRPNETGSKYAPPQEPTQPSQPLRPELPAGQASFMQGQAKDASDRHDAIVAAAAESPMRINVLDNIIKLSAAGVQTGPGSEWQNSVKGYLANTPGVGKLLGSTQANVGNFQELQKFMYQNALRNWQAAGGTGTDSQLESAAKANPNDHLFPQALQTIAKWGKASELAVQGKANAQDQYLQQAGNTPTNQIAFEHTWRNSFDPKIFQYQLMSPQEKQTFAAQELKTPQAAKAFLAKQQQLKQLGAVQ